jgi:hypothetical protein
MLGAKIHIAVLKVRKISHRENFHGRITVVIRSGEITLMTETAYYQNNICLWPMERFTL